MTPTFRLVVTGPRRHSRESLVWR